MPRWSDRAQTEPIAALVAVVAVGVGLSLYVGVLDDERSAAPDGELADVTVERVERTLAPDGVAVPSRIRRAAGSGPDGFRTNVTLTTADGDWRTGPRAPDGADSTTRRIGVRVGPAKVKPGTLGVRVWR